MSKDELGPETDEATNKATDEDEEPEQLYMTVRFYQDRESYEPEILDRDLTLEEAQAQCQDPETSSQTAKGKAERRLTRERGPWFLGFTKDDGRSTY